jgi:hypothetical protein
MTSVALRPAAPDDSEFCYQLHKAAMGGYVTALWGWDEHVQRGFHDRAFNPAAGRSSRVASLLAFGLAGLTRVPSRPPGEAYSWRSRNGGGGR